ncbi:glycoside hydrolase family 13 protein [Neomicrococcus lactis]|uniref:glycoside hydrolase family 13 protein n=1 Tax=Neomicrococcus lactis TaxID=732241 RepID=UPI002301FDAA|nr:glycoside hydrolase family 13 protein [Neomicrococcus lactis]
MLFQPHHDGSALYVDNLHPQLEDTVPVRLRIPVEFGSVEKVWLRSVRDAEPHYDAADRIESAADSADSWYEAHLTMVNPVQKYRWFVQANGRTYWVNAQGVFTHDVPDAADFRLVAGPGAPEWAPSAVMYQIFVDRFARSAQADTHPTPEWAIACSWDETPVIGRGPETPYQFYGGDLDGIREKLDHLVSVGATLVYLTPMFAARSNHRYDAAAFAEVDPLLGGDDALVRLVEAIHERGLKVIGDLTTNHSGDMHEWFRASYKNPEAPESEMYYFGEGNEDYVAWLGVPSLPKFNWHSEHLRRRFVLDDDSMVARWLKPPFNLDGWRIDVGNMTGRHGYDDLNHEIAKLIRDRVTELNPDAVLLSESTSDAGPDFQGDTWHGAMTYTNFTRPAWQWLSRGEWPEPTQEQIEDAAGVNTSSLLSVSGIPVPAVQTWPDYYGVPQKGPDRIEAEQFLETHLSFIAAFPWSVRVCNMNAIDTHDTARAALAVIPGGQEVAAALQFCLPGIPLIFAGDEFGLEGFNGEASRTPMPWEDPSRILRDLRGVYRALAETRRRHPVLADGGIRWLHAEGDALIFVRESRDESVLVVATRAAVDEGLELPCAALTHGEIPREPLLTIGADAATIVSAQSGVVRWKSSGPGVSLFSLPGVVAAK